MKTLKGAPNTTVAFMQTLAARLSLTPVELPIMENICLASKTVLRHQDIVKQGRPNRSIILVMKGFCISYRISRDGGRQIINVLLPGDISGGCFFDGALYSIRSLSDSVVVAWPLDECLKLLDMHPRLAAKILWLLCCDGAICAEHVVVIGRLSPRERIAHFLLELLFRLQAVGLADERSYRVPFSHVVISDALGLSLDHVSRELRYLAQEGLVKITDYKVEIEDVNSLIIFADFNDRYLKPTPIDELMTPLVHNFANQVVT
jgi:CRP-like cAMP-binding protein